MRIASTPLRISRVLLLAAAALLWACSDDTTPLPDTVTPPDGFVGDAAPDLPAGDGPVTDGPVTDTQPPDQQQIDAPPVVSTDFVFDTLRLPMNATLSTTYALELGGQKYNALGDLLSAVVPTLNITGLPESVQNAVCIGDTINLLRVKATNLVNDPAIAADSWVGTPVVCCSAACLEIAQLVCSASAKAQCFNGSKTFQPDPQHPGASPLSGGISASQLQLQPGALKLKISLTSGGSAVVSLKGAVIKGTITAAGITSGVLAGGVPTSEMAGVVLPQMATILNNLLKDPNVNFTTKAAILAAFDTDKDGSVSGAELAGNALLAPYLAGDVDVDADGTKEVSMGIGFTAVGATIQAP
jgi:hypothetical protein